MHCEKGANTIKATYAVLARGIWGFYCMIVRSTYIEENL